METISEKTRQVPAPGVVPPAGDSFATLLGRWAIRLGDQVAVTYLDHSTTPEGRAVDLTWRQLDDRVSAVAAHLRGIAEPGARAAVLAPQSADYVVAFLGAIRAGLIAVPLFAPGLPGHAGRLAATLTDCVPELVLTTAAQITEVTGFLRGVPLRATVVAVDELEPAGPGEHEWHQPLPGELAYLQYTSGSTRSPAGVMLTHHNVITNAAQACAAYGARTGTTSTVSWLPLYHDMGLILGIGAPMVGGLSAVLMDPVAFLTGPGRWLSALSSSPGAISAAPNFAYAYSASRVSESEKDYLDLSRVVSLINGSEPVLPDTIAKFQHSFGPCGLRPDVQRASYGLAEATVLVSVTDAGRPSREVVLDRDRLGAGQAVLAGPGATGTTIVSCGRPVGQRVRIVDPDTGVPVSDGRVGEIRVSGPNVGQGYWGGTESSAATFGSGSPDEDEKWLATGDLGVWFEDELYMTGRIKDLVIVDGRNHYPQDIEQTVEAHPAVRSHSAAAFAIPHGAGEVAVVVLERAKQTEAGVEETVTAVRAAVAAGHGVRLHDVVVLAPGEVPRTSSGKISRTLCRGSYLDGAMSGRLR